MSSSSKLGFWGLFSIVVGSQVGSGILFLPSSLADYGVFSILGWIISGLAAISLSMVFSYLCSHKPSTGGPHTFVETALGKNFAFFTGWTYWVVSWVSSAAVVIASANYLRPILPDMSNFEILSLEVLILTLVTLVNLKSIEFSGSAEVILGIIKLVPLLLVPALSIMFFDYSNFQISDEIQGQSIASILGGITLMTLWGFIGVESGTTPADSVKNPKKTMPLAIFLGTTAVAILYLFNSISIMGLIDGPTLANSSAPYVDAGKIVLGGELSMAISVLASIICIGTLNAWTIASGQILLGLSQGGFMPSVLKQKNSNECPHFCIILNSIGIAVILLLTTNQSLGNQIEQIIDLSVTAFLFVYLISSISLLVLLSNSSMNFSITKLLFGFISAVFCSIVIALGDFNTLLVSSLFVLSGLPVYLLWYKRQK